MKNIQVQTSISLPIPRQFHPVFTELTVRDSSPLPNLTLLVVLLFRCALVPHSEIVGFVFRIIM